MDILEFENASALDVALVKQVVDLLSEAIEIHEVASLVVSGGRTPQGFFHLLSQQALDWSKVTVTCLLYTSPSPRDRTRSRMPSSA